MNYFSKLKGPKVLDLNQGTHGTGEITGLFTLSNYTFKKLHNWFDYWLRDKNNEEKISFNKINIQTDIENKRESFSLNNTNVISNLNLHLHPNIINNGKLKKIPYKGKNIIESFRTHYDTDASTGIPLLSALVDGNFKRAASIYLPDTAIFYGTKFLTPFLSSKLKIRGISSLKLYMTKEMEAIHLNAYLYDVDIFGRAKLITHGTFTRNGREVSQEVNFDLVATAYNIPRGNRIALVLDSKDNLYKIPKSLSKTQEIEFSLGKSLILRIPYLNK